MWCESKKISLNFRIFRPKSETGNENFQNLKVIGRPKSENFQEVFKKVSKVKKFSTKLFWNEKISKPKSDVHF